MDAILSLPIMGYFLMPSLTTYSASLNLLFFYITWSTLVLSHSPSKIEILGTLGSRVLFFIVPSTLFLIFDTLLPSLAVGLKTQGASALPTRTGGLKVAKSGRAPQLYAVIGLSLFNVLLSMAIQGAVEYLLAQVFHRQSALKVATTLPMPWSIARHLMQSLVLREILQYYIHRFILHPAKPTYLSKLHHDYFHAITAPYSFAAHYDHPLSYILFRFIPSYLPCVLFRAHLLTYLLTLSLITIEETLTFSGYAVIPGILLGGFARRQDLHSEVRGKGNFAPWGFLDWVHGTSVGPDFVDDVRDEAEKHRVAERSLGAWNGAKEKGARSLRKKKS